MQNLPFAANNKFPYISSPVDHLLKQNRKEEWQDRTDSPPSAHLGLDCESPVEFCPMQVSNDNFLQSLNNTSFLSQSEPDADGVDDKRFLEYFEKDQSLKHKGTVQEEIYNLKFAPESSEIEEANESIEETKTFQDFKHLAQCQVTETCTDKEKGFSVSKKVVEARSSVKNENKSSKNMMIEKLSSEDKRTLKLGETLVTEYIENTNSIMDDQSEFSRSSAQASEYNASEKIKKADKKDQKPGSTHKHSKKEHPNQKILTFLDKNTADPIRPVYFNIIVVGGTGVGKSTFVDAFLKKKFKMKGVIRPSTQEFQELTGERHYKEMNFKMKLIDTPGYGPRNEPAEWYKSIKSYIKTQYKEYRAKTKEYKNKTRSNQTIPHYPEDNRVHTCLYFISGPRISHLDLIYMKKLQKYTTIIPILAKGDAYTVAEAKDLKLQLIQQAYDSKIEFLDFTKALKDHPKRLKALNLSRFGPCPPFVVVSSVDKIYVDGHKYIYGREFSWGICDIENPEHSDFRLLTKLLGGYICFECISGTEDLYKCFLERKREKTIKAKPRHSDAKKVGIGALTTMGVLGAYMYIKSNIGISL